MLSVFALQNCIFTGLHTHINPRQYKLNIVMTQESWTSMKTIPSFNINKVLSFDHVSKFAERTYMNFKDSLDLHYYSNLFVIT